MGAKRPEGIDGGDLIAWMRTQCIDVDGCWEWTRSRDKAGYARMSYRLATRRCHQVTYEIVNGPVPAGLQIDHLCRNRACCNPDHLEVVTGRENVLRGDTPAARNAAKTHCPAGHAYAGVNLVVDHKGHRSCRTCINAKARAQRAARRNAA